MKLQQPILNVLGWRKRKSKLDTTSNNHSTTSFSSSAPPSRHNHEMIPQLPSIPCSEFDYSGSSVYSMSLATTKTSRSNTLIRPTTRDSTWPSSPKGDTTSLFKEPVWEPLMSDMADEMIPTSVRPLIDSRGKDSAIQQPKQTSFDDFRPKTSPGKFSDAPWVHHYDQESLGSLISYESTRPSTVESAMSYDSSSPSSYNPVPDLAYLPAVVEEEQTSEAEDGLYPILEDDPSSFDLVQPPPAYHTGFTIEKRSDEMFSTEHLQEIFKDPSSMLKFTQYLSKFRPNSVPLLIYYLDALKAIKAISYSNAIAEALTPLPGVDFTENIIDKTFNKTLQDKANKAFETLVQHDLPSYITHVFIQIINRTLYQRVTGTVPKNVKVSLEGLAEVFCLSDPSREDNPIVFASEEFHRTTQYGVEHSIGKNCRFLQGPKTDPLGIERLRNAIKEGKETNELFINYRRDGSSFMNLITVSPLTDSKGQIRYFLGAHVDVTSLCKDCTDLDALKAILARKNKNRASRILASQTKAVTDGLNIMQDAAEDDEEDDFRDLTSMFNEEELAIVNRHGGRMQESYHLTTDIPRRRPLLDPASSILSSPTSPSPIDPPSPPSYTPLGFGPTTTLFQNYLLIRPYPSLRILFASPSLRTPGILQSPFLSRIGGSARVRAELATALTTGAGVTAKVRWLTGRRTVPSSPDCDDGLPATVTAAAGVARWVHCTPLLGRGGAVGVWMVVLVDELDGMTDGAATTTSSGRSGGGEQNGLGRTGGSGGLGSATSLAGGKSGARFKEPPPVLGIGRRPSLDTTSSMGRRSVDLIERARPESRDAHTLQTKLSEGN